MGLVLDSSVLIAAERDKRLVSLLLATREVRYSVTEFFLSSVTIMELEHGCHRANSPQSALKRRSYLDEILAIIPVAPFTCEMGVLAGKIEAEMRKTVVAIATADLLIGVTALHGGHGVVTTNLRHFRRIPGLAVLPL